MSAALEAEKPHETGDSMPKVVNATILEVTRAEAKVSANTWPVAPQRAASRGTRDSPVSLSTQPADLRFRVADLTVFLTGGR